MKGDSLKVITVLFRSHFVLDWIQHKVVSKYKSIEPEQILSKILSAFNRFISEEKYSQPISAIIILIYS